MEEAKATKAKSQEEKKRETRNIQAEHAYAAWRFQYWVKKGDMTYIEIDEAVVEGKLKPGEMP